MRRDSSCLVGGILAYFLRIRFKSRSTLIYPSIAYMLVAQFVARDKQVVIETSLLEDAFIKFEVELMVTYLPRPVLASDNYLPHYGTDTTINTINLRCCQYCKYC